MKITKLANDETVLSALGERLAHARLDRNLTQSQLAAQAGISKRTVERIETGSVATRLTSFIHVCRVLDMIERFDLLISDPVSSPVEQLKLHARMRQRASARKKAKPSLKKWHWGDEK